LRQKGSQQDKMFTL